MNSITEEIKSRIDIIDLIAEYMDLKRAGQNYKGLCPFHSEKTPSFMVSPSKQIFHCFGCHKGGDIFAFVMNYENMTFQEAVSHLSQKAGIKTEVFKGDSKIKGMKESLFAIQKEALLFFQNNLKISKQATSYLKERGLNSETIERFSIGYSKSEKDSLFSHLKEQGFSLEHIKASGLVNSGEKGVYDFFRDRLMFPIFDLQGRAIAFGGRILSNLKNMPKYINSPDSIIFKKGETSYGLNIAKSTITQKGYSIIVEGYLDAIMCHQYGFANAIAPLGTALTSGQLKKLKRFSNKVLLIFDGDSAGISATKRSIELCYAEGMIAKILLLPQGEDPDTFLRRHGEENFRKYMSKAISPAEFLLMISGKSKLDAVRYMLQVISSCPDPLQRDEAIRELSDKSKTNELTLREELKNVIQKTLNLKGSGMHSIGTSQKEFSKSNKIKEIKKEIKTDEEILLNIALSMPEKTNVIIDRIDIKIVENPVIRGIFEKIKTYTADESNINKGLLIEKLLSICNEGEQKLITMFSVNPQIDEEHADESIECCLKKIVLKNIEKQIKAAEQLGDEKLLDSLTRHRNYLRNLSHKLKGGNLVKN
ncbi:MAG: DNA primase [Nitrospiraceae bacterium]|nr:DNA primase [Nitrospiraceae bacterium]